MEEYEIPLVDRSGRVSGYGDRWLSHTVSGSTGNLILGQKHVGITIACIDHKNRILLEHRKHKIFDKTWSLSGDTHPRKYKSREVETLSEASSRCASEDLGVRIEKWAPTLTVSYSAPDPRNSTYCENELLSVMVARYEGELNMNAENAYDLVWEDMQEIRAESLDDLRKRPADRKYAPWVHAIFTLPYEEVQKAFSIKQ